MKKMEGEMGVVCLKLLYNKHIIILIHKLICSRITRLSSLTLLFIKSFNSQRLDSLSDYGYMIQNMRQI